MALADKAYEKDLDEAEKSTALDFMEMDQDQERHDRPEQLHSIPVGLLKRRPLKLLRSVEGRNGLEVWRLLSRLQCCKLTCFILHLAKTREPVFASSSLA